MTTTIIHGRLDNTPIRPDIKARFDVIAQRSKEADERFIKEVDEAVSRELNLWEKKRKNWRGNPEARRQRYKQHPMRVNPRVARTAHALARAQVMMLQTNVPDQPNPVSIQDLRYTL